MFITNEARKAERRNIQNSCGGGRNNDRPIGYWGQQTGGRNAVVAMYLLPA